MNEWGICPERERDRLMNQHPGWQVWYVDLVGGRTAWSARPTVVGRTVLAYDPAELGRLMTRHEPLTSS